MQNLFSQNANTPLQSLKTLENIANSEYITLNPWLLTNLYKQSIVKHVVEMPVYDGLRKGYDITTSQLSEDENNQIKRKIKKGNILHTIKRALILNRLYGGAAIIINANDGRETSEELQIKENTQITYYPIERWRLSKMGNTDIMQDFWGYDENEAHKKFGTTDETYYIINGKKFHKSRIIIIKGEEVPYHLAVKFQFWGMSLLETLAPQLTAWVEWENIIYELAKEAKVDVIQLEDFDKKITTDQGKANLMQTLQEISRIRNYKGILSMPLESKFESKQISFASYDEVYRLRRQSLSQASEIPETRLFGFAATGMNSSNEEMNENYAQMLEAKVLPNANACLEQIIELEMLSTFGYIPDDLDVNFKTPHYESSKDKAEIHEKYYATYADLHSRGLLTSKEFVKALNETELFPNKIEIAKNAPDFPVPQEQTFSSDED